MNNLELFTIYNFNHRVLHINLEGMTHADSLKQPVEGGNSLNWIIGHILVSRDDIFEELGLDISRDEELFKQYERGSKDFPKADAVKLDELVKMLDESQVKLENKFKEVSLTDEKKIKNLTFLAFHEAYHCGQTGILRRTSGKEGAIK